MYLQVVGIERLLSYVLTVSTNSPALFLAVEKGTNIELGVSHSGIGGFAAYKTAGYTHEYFGITDEALRNQCGGRQGRLAPEYTGE